MNERQEIQVQGSLLVVKEHYTTIDIFKLFFAFMIVFMHCYCRDWGTVGWWLREVISTVGVPFFFIASGFFMERGFDESKDKQNYLKNYVKRVGMMYISWAIISLPLFIYVLNVAHPEYSVVMKSIYIMRTLFLSGAMGVYWYVLVLVFIAPVFYLMHKNDKLIMAIYIIATIGYVFGVCFDAGCFSTDSIIWFTVKSIFGSTRNFLMVGLFYMCLGRIIYNMSSIPNLFLLVSVFLLFIVLRTIEVHYFSFSFLQTAIAVVSFIIALKINLRSISKNVAVLFRELSTAIYLIHFPLILMFDFYLRRGTIIDMFVVLVLSIVIYYIIGKLPNKKISKVLFGH